MQLTRGQARLKSDPIKMLNVVAFLMSFAFFILYPLLANHLISWKRIAVITVTFIINTRIVVQDALMLPGSFFLKKVSPQVVVASGCTIRGIGFLILSLTDNLALLLFAGVLSGIGGALFFPSMHAMYTGLTEETNRLMVFAKRERYNSLGAVLGPLLGSILTKFGFVWVGVVSFFMFLVGSVFVLFIKTQHSVTTKTALATVPVKDVVSDSTFMLFAFATMLIMQISNQTGIAVAVRIDQLEPTFPYIGVLSSLSAVMMVLFQIHLLKALNKSLRRIVILVVSDAFFILGFLMLGFSRSMAMVLLSSIVFSVGSMLHLPTRDTLLSKYVKGNSVATYYGFFGVFNTFGTLILASVFGKLYDLSYNSGFRFIPWAILGITGVVGIIVLFGIAGKIERDDSELLERVNKA